jgi:hypothetical protein
MMLSRLGRPLCLGLGSALPHPRGCCHTRRCISAKVQQQSQPVVSRTARVACFAGVLRLCRPSLALLAEQGSGASKICPRRAPLQIDTESRGKLGQVLGVLAVTGATTGKQQAKAKQAVLAGSTGAQGNFAVACTSNPCSPHDDAPPLARLAGTFLDGIHSKVQLLVYDLLPVDVAQLHTSAFVPPLLASFYVVLGGLVLWSDHRMASDLSTRLAVRRSNSLLYLVASFGWVERRAA